MKITATDTRLISYTGPSMQPSLKPGDLLHVEPLGNNFSRGTIIVFYDQQKEMLVHRIISIHCSGVITKGDNNRQPDAGILPLSRIVGHVTAVQRGNKQLNKLFWTARGYVLGLKVIKMTEWATIDLLHPIYIRLSGRPWPTKFFNRLFKPNFLYFNKPEGTEIQMFIGHRMIARYYPNDKEWLISRPFKLFINQSKLPNPQK